MKKISNKVGIGACLLAMTLLVGCTGSGVSANGTDTNAEMIPVTEEVVTEEISEQSQSQDVAEEETVEEAKLQEPVEVVISLAGDCSFGKLSIHSYENTFNDYFNRYGAGYFFQNVKSLFEEDDLTLVNFEGVLTESKDLQEKEYNIKGRREFIDVLTEGSVEAVSFGNNHRFDYGQQGMDDTIAAFHDVNVVYAYDENVGIYETESGIKIGFVSINEVYDEEKVEVFLEQGINALKEECDLILACCHWGEETHHYPEDYQVELGRKCIDWGADLVVGCHPHVLQGLDYYNGKYIIYSLGNFCFGGHKNPKDKNAMIVQVTATIDANGPVGELQLKVIPCRISGKNDINDYCPYVPEGERFDEIIGLVNKYSSDFPVSVSKDGTVTHE